MIAKEEPQASLVASLDQPLIALIMEEDGHEVVRYFVDGDEANTAVADQPMADALALAGAWSHMDWNEMFESLDRVRHENPPTPPIDL